MPFRLMKVKEGLIIFPPHGEMGKDGDARGAMIGGVAVVVVVEERKPRPTKRGGTTLHVSLLHVSDHGSTLFNAKTHTNWLGCELVCCHTATGTTYDA